MRYKKIVTASLIVIFIVFLGWLTCFNSISYNNNNKLSPVIMIPGSNAGINRFDKTVQTINKHTDHQHSLLKIEVTKHDKLKVKGKIKPHDKEPFIVIGFQCNQDGYKHIKKQTQQLDLAFRYLYKRYHFNSFKALGHSNGGLIWTRWLELYYNNYYPDIKIKKLLTIGTPYNFEENSLQHETLLLHDLRKDNNKLPSNLRVTCIGGTSSYESDGIVREGSYRCAKYIFQNHVKKFTMITITGDDSGHSDLPTNKQVISIIEQHLLDDKSAKLYELKQKEQNDEN